MPKLYLYGIIALALGGLIWHDHWIAGKLKASKAATAQATSILEGERANRKTEQDDRKRNDEADQSLQTDIAAIPKPDASVRVLCRPASVPRTTAESLATAVPVGPTADGSAGEPLQDFGALLEAVRVEAQTNATRHQALIEWEQSRVH